MTVGIRSVRLNHVEKQIKTLGYTDGDRVCLRAFLPEKGKDAGRKLEFEMPSIPVDDLNKWQEEGRGIYLVVNPGGHDDASITKAIAIFYEHDDLDKEISKQLWETLGLPQPTMQIDTGGKSIHSYWVFESPISVEDWRSIQTDLLNFSDGDRKLKNPSRVMRLAGCLHAATGSYSLIVDGCGKSYDYQQLRKIIPVSGEAIASKVQPITWQEFNQSFRFPIDEAIPLEACLSRKNRDLLASGEQSGSRSDGGFRLASDLLAVSAFLVGEGQRFSGDPYDLFLSYCQKCPPGGGWNQSEWDLIWKSAQSKPRTAALPPDYIENCVKAWAWQNCPKTDALGVGRTLKALDNAPRSVEIEDAPDTATDEEKLRVAIANYVKVSDAGNRFQIIPLRNKIAKEFSISKSEIEDLAKELRRGEAGSLSPVSDGLIETLEEIQVRSACKELTGVPCGFYDLDAMTQGFQRSDLIIAAGRPSMGKTSFVLNVARNTAMGQQLPVVVFSLEMSKTQLVYRLLSSEAQIETGRLRSGRIHDTEWDAIAHSISALSEMPLWVDDTPEITTTEIEAKVKRLMTQHEKLGLIIIDYLQLMAGEGDNRNLELSRITRSLKGLARELNVPIIALSQLSRGVESRTNKRPMMSDLRESGGIEQDADLILMLYRDEYYNPDTPDRGIAEVIITKHRNGPVGTAKLLFEPQFTRFRNLARIAA